jgi:ribosomal protein L28
MFQPPFCGTRPLRDSMLKAALPESRNAARKRQNVAGNRPNVLRKSVRNPTNDSRKSVRISATFIRSFRTMCYKIVAASIHAAPFGSARRSGFASPARGSVVGHEKRAPRYTRRVWLGGVRLSARLAAPRRRPCPPRFAVGQGFSRRRAPK